MTCCGEREEDSADFVDGFVAHGTIDEADAAAGVEALDVCGQGARSGGVVGAIEDDLGIFGDALQAAGPAGLRNPGARSAASETPRRVSATAAVAAFST